MKKIVYSNITKAVAVILFIASIVLGALTVTNGITRSNQEKQYIYGFENDFSESWHLQSLLEVPQYTIYYAYDEAYRIVEEMEIENDAEPLEEGITAPDWETELTTERIENAKPDMSPVDPDILEQRIRESLDNLYCSDRINYFVEWNGIVFTNCGASDAKDLMEDEFFASIQRKANEDWETTASYDTIYTPLMDISEYDRVSTITVCTSVKQAYVDECKAMWERQEAIFIETFTVTLALAVFALLLLIYLVCVCGRNAAGEQKIIWLDYVWTEIHLAFMGGLGIGGVALCVCLLDGYINGDFPLRLLPLTVGVTAALTAAGVLTSLLSIVRNIKSRRFVASSLILSLIRWIIKGIAWILKWIYRKGKAFKRALVGLLSKKTGILLICMLFIYTVIIGFGVFAAFDGALLLFWMIAAVLLFVAACYVLARRSVDLDEIKKGVREIRSGNVTYQIPEPGSEDMKSLAGNVNDIAQGLDEAVSAKLKAERLKAELITNVSHDLKTPLTSIISYTELLSKVEGLPEEARDYVQVIAKKNERLKNLTQDLFDISKAQSGNEEVVLEKLDIALLIGQALGEHDGEIRESELPFCVDTPKDLYILADGRKMSRVVGNLLNNILKYAMKHTRVFISALQKDGMILLEFKNISAYPMDFRADEIVGRFVRGDESRTADGNGLGLAIAKSYTELCGGAFEIVTDGDLFKAILTFKEYKEETKNEA